MGALPAVATQLTTTEATETQDMGFFWSAPAACTLMFAAIFALRGACFASSEAPGEAKKLYIVYLGERQHQDADLVTASHHTMLASVLGSKELASESIVYSYKHGLSGFSAMLTESQARNIRGLPGVASVWMNQMHTVVTTRSWDFMGLPYNQKNGLLADANMGDGIIIGVIDSGIWPESPSFDDTGYAPPAAKWKGICQSGMSFSAKSCNRKIIGARWYADDFNKSQLEVEGEFLSPRDINGHGTHVASIAAGNVVRNISFYGLASGVAQGGAPKARIAVYKACWSEAAPPSEGTCSEAAIIKAIDDAIHDGVDILSLSILSLTGHIPAFHAVVKGIPVIYAAGNYGPYTQTVNNVAPWLLTVAASTIDRLFPTAVTLGNGQTLVGQSLFVARQKANQFHKLKLYINDMCNLTVANSTDVKGNIILCFNLNTVFTTTQLVKLATAVVENGGEGFIFTQRSDLLATWQFLALTIPIVSVDLEVAFKIYQYFSTTQSPLAKISLSQTTTGRGIPAPKIAAFSSRGPSFIYPAVLKPDIAAPGVNILAAAPQVGIYKEMGLPYFLDSGTSMSCPHVSGIVALLKSVHPDWSPAALKSAIMTTAAASPDLHSLTVTGVRRSTVRRCMPPTRFPPGLLAGAPLLIGSGADMVAVYALGLISRNVQSASISVGCHQVGESDGFTKSSNQLAFFWVPFLLIHLGGQDTMTAFSIEDNNLWLRHLLNLSIQVYLALYAYWKSTGRTISQMKERHVFRFQGDRPPDQVPKLLEVELAMMYDDLYTKAMVLQTRSGIMLRCISHVFMIAAFVLFLIASNKQQYNRADIAITYVLFIGGFVLDVCSFFLVAMSPWTWAFFRAQNCYRLAHISWLILCSCIGWPEKKPLWSNSMGHYNFLNSCMGFDESRSSSKILTISRKMLNAVNKKLWFRKIWHIKHVEVNKDIMDTLVTWVRRLAREEFTRITQEQNWVNLRPIIDCTLNTAANSFGDNIVLLHIYTDLHLRKQPDDEAIGTDSETTSSSTANIMDTCRKISNYIVYLLVVQPSMLPLTGTADDTIAAFYEKISKKGSRKQDVLETCYQLVEDQLEFGYEECLKEQEEPRAWRDTLMEIRDMWMRLLIYIAGKCQVEQHAQQLGRGGELLTFVWLLMAHHDIGDVARQFDLITSSETMSGQFSAFHFPKESEQ
ncbi:hypothetical protein E2562_019621 [Oryza meyeriana var. granulata]|uniref:Peptidase S8/S53 domain-containing protein n=1 Tax=Oryza meyeriana var. granulata TaxID=110450 RepID=A0A6G1C950_9ORYZ|nr:hypothetical protein E2562_019621 [Oryza meyeriana var. granulata]